jgi:hypothetical protein
MELCKKCFEAGFISEASCEIEGAPTCNNCSTGKNPADTEGISVIPKDAIPSETVAPKGQTVLLMLALKRIPMGKAIFYQAQGRHENAGSSAKNYLIKRLKKLGVHANGKHKGRFVWLWRVK